MGHAGYERSIVSHRHRRAGDRNRRIPDRDGRLSQSGGWVDPDEGKFRRTPRHGSANARDCHLPPKRLPPRVTQIDIDHILLIEEIRQLLEAAEQVGNVRASDLAEIAET